MKTAEEWLTQLPPDILEHPMPLPQRLDYGLKIIRQIQLDAIENSDRWNLGAQAMARHCICAVQGIKRSEFTIDWVERWLKAVIENDAGFMKEAIELIVLNNKKEL